MSDWIDHDGKEPPDLAAGTMVDIRLRDSGPIVALGTGAVENWDWNHDPDDAEHDIVAYRVVPNE